MHQIVHHWVYALPLKAQLAIWFFGNLSLAVVPVILARWLRGGVERDLEKRGRVRWLLWAPVALLWLMFLPNTAYLLTEWRHYLTIVMESPGYYPVLNGLAYPAGTTRDLVSLTAFFGMYSLAGLIALVYAVRPVEAVLGQVVKPTGAPAVLKDSVVAGVFLLCSVGVYLGLVNRLNSWDPFNARTLLTIAGAPLRIASSPRLAVMIVSFAVFLWLVYRFMAGRMDRPPSFRRSG
jgi:uncharacterized membrane protein